MLPRLKPIWRDALALLFAVWDARTPTTARLGAGLALAHALSPVDLIPDAVPVLGLGDDLLMVPAVLALAARSADLRRRWPWLLPALGVSLLLGVGLPVWALWRGLRLARSYPARQTGTAANLHPAARSGC